MIFSLLLLISFSAPTWAQNTDYTDGFYSCLNSDAKLPRNSYNIKTLPVFANGAGVPHVEITRHFRNDLKSADQRVQKVVLRGTATVIAYDDGTTILKLMNIEIPFKNGTLQKCLP